MIDDAMYLEDFIVPYESWEDAPTDGRVVAEQSLADGIPTAIARHPERGWFVLQTGQGPYIAWRSNVGEEDHD